jgi:hypothetical protein
LIATSAGPEAARRGRSKPVAEESVMINLTPNSFPIETFVRLGDGTETNLRIEPGDAWVCPDGYVRIFTIHYSDGGLGNFKLLPRNRSRSAVFDFITEFLVPFGLSLAGGRLVKGKAFVSSLGKFLGVRAGSVFIKDLFERSEIEDSAYFAIDNGELVITHPIRAY